MAAVEVSYAAAAGAGLLSFLSPCVLPLVPAYMCFLGGVSLEQISGADGQPVPRATTRRVFIAAIAFVLGFSAVFVALGAGASTVSGLILQNKLLLGKIAGVLIILFGLHFMGIFRLAFLNYEARFHLRDRPAGIAGAFILGVAFAFGWTPCIGPVLATVLTVAARDESLAFGTSLLAAYAAGLGVPFLLAAAGTGPFMRWMARFRRHMQRVEMVVGGLLVVTGILFLFNSFEVLAFWLLEAFPGLGDIG